MVRLRGLRHRVTVLTLCPLGEPEIAISHESRIEPWLPRNRIACPVSRTYGRCHLKGISANSGLDIETKTSRAISRGEALSLKSFYRTTYLRMRCCACDVSRLSKRLRRFRCLSRSN